MFDLQSNYQYLIFVKGLQIGNGSLMVIPKALLDTGNTCISIPVSYEKSILDQFNKGENKCVFSFEESAPAYSLLKCKVASFDALSSLMIKTNKNDMVIEK